MSLHFILRHATWQWHISSKSPSSPCNVPFELEAGPESPHSSAPVTVTKCVWSWFRKIIHWSNSDCVSHPFAVSHLSLSLSSDLFLLGLLPTTVRGTRKIIGLRPCLICDTLRRLIPHPKQSVIALGDNYLQFSSAGHRAFSADFQSCKYWIMENRTINGVKCDRSSSSSSSR